MAKFAIFFRFKGETVKAMMSHPSDRAAVVRALCESAGGGMDAYYLMFGSWDGMVIATAPDSRTAASISLAVSSTGAFAELETHELIDAGAIGAILSDAASLTYSPPGA